MFYTIKILLNHPTRFILTVIGIALCMILMLFLFGIYKGVADGSVEYIRENKVDLWVLQRNSTNILRGTSILSAYQTGRIKKNENVIEVSPALLLLTTVKNSGKRSTIFLAGYDIETGLGGPPKLIKGKNVNADNEIVLDNSFALNNGFNVGDELIILEDTLKVCGISSGTNAFVIQYAFTTLAEAQSLLGFPGIVTCYLVKLKNGSDVNETAAEIQELIAGSVVYNHNDFLENNIKEMESGFLPILYAVASLGAIVLTTVLSLILSINILERKKDFAVMKILGSPSGFLPKLIIQQAVFISLISGGLSLILYFPLVSIIEKLSPEVSTITTLSQILIVLIVGLLMGVLSSIIALSRLRKIYPLEVFYER
ncbi:MAG: FtsX-like permease family protein [Ignavibacterium sp.]|jgi:putative ABC transport system permease protein|nr:FtsX-like permease family protein [Ignavibacterium sp.]